jgi:hypothetical protein
MKETGVYTASADKLGVASAVICTVHCLAVPLLFILKNWFQFNSAGAHLLPAWWETLDYVFLFVSFLAVYHASAHAASKKIKTSLWVFWVCLVIAIFFAHQLHWMAYIASAGLVLTHVANIRKHRKKASAI